MAHGLVSVHLSPLLPRLTHELVEVSHHKELLQAWALLQGSFSSLQHSREGRGHLSAVQPAQPQPRPAQAGGLLAHAYSNIIIFTLRLKASQQPGMQACLRCS